ncbi:hypothetical protein [Burkholderia sp. Ac-20353]|uniref:hypothetical protein n=1 Tax=Burkholderia sp. Ac-20353 TaxID=2703894 RepID=UPI00197C12FD|nr:hypothetical protein [Burkholderia sp. Ac-20353]MBN3786189.1 hypothetical protein [Burkholderia sp. Ac-20353]
MQSKLSAGHFWGGQEELLALAKNYEEQVKDEPLLPIFLYFFKRRIEATDVKGRLRKQLADMLKDEPLQEIHAYLTNKIFWNADVALDSMSISLGLDERISGVDLYEILIHILQSLASMQNLSRSFIDLMRKPVTVLFERVGDCRLHGVLRAFGVPLSIDDLLNSERAQVIEAYSNEKYGECIASAQRYLSDCPDDIGVLVISAKAHAHIGLPPAANVGIVHELNANLYRIFCAGPDAYISAHWVMTMSDRFYGQAWMDYVRLVVMNELQPQGYDFPSLWLRDIYIRDKHLSPFSAITIPKIEANLVLSSAAMVRTYPATLNIFLAVAEGKCSNESGSTRVEKYLAQHYLSSGCNEEAFSLYSDLLKRVAATDKLRCAGGLALAALKIKRYGVATKVIVDAFLEHPHTPSTLPIPEVVHAMDSPKIWPNIIEFPLLLELYLDFVERDRLPNLRVAFEKFQRAHKIHTPEDLIARLEDFGKPTVTAYLERVWRPEVMRQTLLYSGTREIDDARIQVCRAIANLDSDLAPKYLDEIKERVKQQEIAKGTTLVEQSKVYVDIDAIKKSLRTKLGDSYARYKLISSSTPNQPDDLLNTLTQALAQSLSQTGDKSLAKLFSTLQVLGGPISTETDAQFAALFAEVTNEFLLGDHGLNAYLSTRVRHGSLSNTLRNPVEDLKLITPREENQPLYVKNTYWLSDCSSVEAEELSSALEAFSLEFDGVLDFLKDRLLRIRVIHEFSSSSDNLDALFVYRTSKLESKFVQEFDRQNSELDQLVDTCVDTLWEKTDENLAVVRQAIETSVRDRLMGSFEALSKALVKFDASVTKGLFNAIAQAKTAMQMKITIVSSWFKRSEVFDRQDYAMEFPVQIALNMIRNTISAASSWSTVKIKANTNDKVMTGRTLDGMVYVFYGLLENAIKRSKLPVHRLSLDVDLSFEKDKYLFRVTNPVNIDAFASEDFERIAQSQQSIGGKESGRRAQAEGQSGLHKIWSTISAPTYRSPQLSFGLRDKVFFVEFSFSLERADYENLAR